MKYLCFHLDSFFLKCFCNIYLSASNFFTYCAYFHSDSFPAKDITFKHGKTLTICRKKKSPNFSSSIKSRYKTVRSHLNIYSVLLLSMFFSVYTTRVIYIFTMKSSTSLSDLTAEGLLNPWYPGPGKNLGCVNSSEAFIT